MLKPTPLTERTRDGWARCVDAVKREGGNFLAQLWHTGPFRLDGQGLYPDVPPIGPSGVFAGKPRGRAATYADIAYITDAYATAAALAQDVGFDGVEIHMAHGYLLHQFLWHESNLRDDEYGGDAMEGRVRFPSEVVAAIRAQNAQVSSGTIGDLPIVAGTPISATVVVAG